MEVTLQSENGMLGIGPFPYDDEVDPDLINAGKQTISELAASAYFGSAQSLRDDPRRAYRPDVLGAMEVSEKGDIANWMIPGKMVKGMGGAMDLVAGVKKIIVVMEHVSKNGDPKFIPECTLPLTGRNVVDMIITDLCVFHRVDHMSPFRLIELAPDVFPKELVGKSETDGPFTASMKSSLVDQLARIGIRPDQVTYVGISHRHDDHTGQLPEFPHSTLLIGAGDFETLKARKSDRITPWTKGGGRVEAVTGDKDVFGDGSVVMLDMPGHTEAHHSLLVRLPRSGPVLLTGDLYHFAENRATGGVPGFNTSRSLTMASMARFEAIARNLHARVIIQHEPADIPKLPAFPASAR
jgi:3-oxoacid CoA-transferase subunit B